MFCGSCGKFVDEGNKFCTGCGQKITPIGINPISESGGINYNSNPIDLGNNKQDNNNYNKLNYQDDVVCKTQDKVNVWLVIIGFLIPLVGLILFICLKKNTPKKANAIGVAALIGFILSIVVSIFCIIYAVAAFAFEFTDYYNDFDENFDSYYDDYYYYEDYEFDYDSEFDRLDEELESYYNENRI